LYLLEAAAIKQEEADEDEDQDEEMMIDEMVEEMAGVKAQNTEDGKSHNTFTPTTHASAEAVIPDTGVQGSAKDHEDEFQAVIRGMSLEDWRAWKAENPYGDLPYQAPPTPK
jgi:hypothetical protein